MSAATPIVRPLVRSLLVATISRASPLPDIGTAGTAGFGVGVAPDLAAAQGYTALAGYDDATSDNYGNYQYTDGSIMVWIPAFYYRIGHLDSPHYAAYGANAIDVASWGEFANVAAANAAGYALHRAFYDNGQVQPGFFADKYMASNNGGIASSIALGAPLSTHPDHNPISGLTGTPGNFYGGCFDAAKTRGPQFFPAMRYMHTVLALLATAHGQAATSAAACAWYDAAGTTNFPKGNNNNAFADANDTSVTFTHDGYSGGNSALTGSGTPFAKTTHNGQACGVTDLNGNMYEVSPGLTYGDVSAQSVTSRSSTNPVTLGLPAHGLATGAQAMVTGVNGLSDPGIYQVTVVDADTVSLDGIDGTGFPAWTGAGSVTRGTLYALDIAARAASLTSGNSSATDAWGAAGLAAHSTPIAPSWDTAGGYVRRYGNGAAAVFDAAVSGDGWVRTAMGMALGSGVSTGGEDLFGRDYYLQYIRNELCPIACMHWSYGSGAGVWGASFYGARGTAVTAVGFRAASYL